MMTARQLTWDLVATKVTNLGKDIRIEEVLDEVCPGPACDVCIKLGQLSKRMAPSVNAVSSVLCGKFEAISYNSKLVQPNQETKGE